MEWLYILKCWSECLMEYETNPSTSCPKRKYINTKRVTSLIKQSPNHGFITHGTYTRPVSMFWDVPSMVCVYAVENDMMTCSSAEPWYDQHVDKSHISIALTLFSTGPPNDINTCWFLLNSELTLVLSSGRQARICCISNWMIHKILQYIWFTTHHLI